MPSTWSSRLSPNPSLTKVKRSAPRFRRVKRPDVSTGSFTATLAPARVVFLRESGAGPLLPYSLPRASTTTSSSPTSTTLAYLSPPHPDPARLRRHPHLFPAGTVTAPTRPHRSVSKAKASNRVVQHSGARVDQKTFLDNTFGTLTPTTWDQPRSFCHFPWRFGLDGRDLSFSLA